MDPNLGAPQPVSYVSQYNTRVFKEPRGMIRIIQLVFAILAFATTTSFDTQTSFTISCIEKDSQYTTRRLSTYQVEYPFNQADTKLVYLSKCNDNSVNSKKFDIDFSSSAQFFVTTGVLCLLYCLSVLFVYTAYPTLYEQNPVYSVGDLVITSVFTIFWLSGASAWAANVSDLKYYTGPRYLISQLSHCNTTTQDNFTYDCFPESPGKWSTLYISLIFGFANMFLWGSSIWFVFKETSFHRRTLQPQPTGPYPGIATGPPMTSAGPVMDQMGQMQGQIGMTQPNQFTQFQ